MNLIIPFQKYIHLKLTEVKEVTQIHTYSWTDMKSTIKPLDLTDTDRPLYLTTVEHIFFSSI